jgi:hypothetical protein
MDLYLEYPLWLHGPGYPLIGRLNGTESRFRRFIEVKHILLIPRIEKKIFFGFFYAFLQNCEKATISFVMSVCPHGKKLASTELVFMKFNIWGFFENLSRKFMFLYNLTRITGTLHEDLCTFMIISRWILLRKRNVSDKSCIENQNTHFMLSNFSPKSVPFIR